MNMFHTQMESLGEPSPFLQPLPTVSPSPALTAKPLGNSSLVHSKLASAPLSQLMVKKVTHHHMTPSLRTLEMPCTLNSEAIVIADSVFLSALSLGPVTPSTVRSALSTCRLRSGSFHPSSLTSQISATSTPLWIWGANFLLVIFIRCVSTSA